MFPFFLVAILITVFVSYQMYSTIIEDTKILLSNSLNTFCITLDKVYPGEYEIVEADLYKGSVNCGNNMQKLLDEFSINTDLEYSMFNGNWRILTTIKDSNNNSMAGTIITSSIHDEVLEENKDAFFSDIELGYKKYMVMYSPIYSSNNECIGMLSVAKETKNIMQLVQKRTFPIIIFCLCLLVFITFLSVNLSDNIISRIQELTSYVVKLKDGKFNNGINKKLLQAEDELGTMCRNIISMKLHLQLLIEKDALTGLYNRRTGSSKLEEIHSSGEKFCIITCDIDYFKKVNDTYGHDAGDLVLKKVANILNTSVKGLGFCARMGGEEFLIVLEHGSLVKGTNVANCILERIRNMNAEYNGAKIPVTMTFGVVEYNGENIEQLLKMADEKLYLGKESGRNRVIS